MALFVVSHRSHRAPAEAWERLTDWPRHGQFVPLTHVTVPTAGPGGQFNGVGTKFVARTALGRVGFDDPMTVVSWQPPAGDQPGHCRLEKQGRLMLGWAELTVEAADKTSGAGSVSTCREDISVNHLPRLLDGVTAASSRLLFGRVLRKLID